VSLAGRMAAVKGAGKEGEGSQMGYIKGNERGQSVLFPSHSG